MPTVPETPELLAYLRECGIDHSTGRPIIPEPAPALPEETTEKNFRALIVAFAKDNGWLHYHVFDSRRSEAGFPDDHFLRGPRQVVAEVKDATGKLAASQKKWINAYRKAGVAAFVWRPENWEEIKRVLGEVR